MIPKTEKELELYFLLQDLNEAKKAMERPYTINYPNQEFYTNRYIALKDQYLKLSNE